MKVEKKDAWFPFRSDELQVGLGLFGFLVTGLALAGIDPKTLAWASLLFIVLFYLAGLLVQARRAARALRFVHDGGIAGSGYLEPFRQARRCLFLMHVDDDPPSEELQALYRTLLERGVEIRRTIFLRPDAAPAAYEWIARFGNHPNLQQRVVLPDQAAAMRLSFVVVDDAVVLLSVPGTQAIDAQPYTARFVLRHLLRIEDATVASVFMRVHEDLWQSAEPLADAALLVASRAG